MRRAHSMPFGAELRRDGTARFRLWAPSATSVELLLHADDRVVARGSRDDDGWYEFIAEASAGTRYRYRIDRDIAVPDPASRWNPEDVHRGSMVVDPLAYEWSDAAWRGRPWQEAVLYELHVGTFTPEGTFAAAMAKLDYLVELGVTAVELMPVADFPGARNWGYDGVLLFAPDARYGAPDDLKRFVDAAHARNLMVFLDVVYNHFGPEGNYLHLYAQPFFAPERQTPWGAAIDFDGAASRTVRDFFVHNALYWIAEFHVDGLRLDAVHAIVDSARPDIVTEIALAVRAQGAREGRHVHVVVENDGNQTRYLARDPAGGARIADAQWNDDVHHALHVVLTRETDGYYGDYAAHPLWYVGRSLAEGFGYQGERSAYRGGVPRGDLSAFLPPTAFVGCLQTHDQVGNRAFGERIGALADPHALRLAVACVLLAPSPPLLFMGEEFAATTPFLFFCDFEPSLAAAVMRGRRAQFARAARLRASAVRETIPDPNAPASFQSSKLRWEEAEGAAHRAWLEFYRACLALRRGHVTPKLPLARRGGTFTAGPGSLLRLGWDFADGSAIRWALNFGATPSEPVTLPAGVPFLVLATSGAAARACLPPFAGVFTLASRE